jgi:hypothetical protein
VSFTAVPAHAPNAVSVSPSACPIAGKAMSATRLKRKIVPTANATSSSSASTSGAIVSTAVAPQIAVPHPSRSRTRRDVPNARPAMAEIASEIRRQSATSSTTGAPASRRFPAVIARP